MLLIKAQEISETAPKEHGIMDIHFSEYHTYFPLTIGVEMIEYSLK
jgi:hypothetical protein